MDRQRLVPILVLVLIGLLGLGLAFFAFSGSDSGTQVITTNGYPAPLTGAEPTYIPPATSTRQQSTGPIAIGPLNVSLPSGATDVERTRQGNEERISFSLGAISGAASAQPPRVGERLEEVASLYGEVRGHKTARLGSSKAYYYADNGGRRFSIVIIGMRKGRLMTVQLVGPQSQFGKARTVARRLAASMG